MEPNSTLEKPSIVAVGIKYGLFIGIASILFLLILVAIGQNPFISDWKNWLGIVITIAILYFSHKEFKDKGDGYMSYGQGFLLSFVAMMVSLVIGLIFTYSYSSFIDTGALEEMYQKTASDMEAKGQSQESIDIAISWTKKLFWVFYIIGGAIMGGLVALIVPIFTQKKNPTPTYL